ncbi:MAG: hypothetical protein EZS28_008957 [Streblomastix strix]|uniref:SPRY domain-containing protein n=1 Tax=Streblomastix strix TaxID=222440 RepID=A0A5J4WLL1_9EUKA|nr:MAG: hypothetical protein EZS28_008957 [Streblomastix strix]
MATNYSDSLRNPQISGLSSENIQNEIPVLVNGLLSDDKDQLEQITQKLLQITLHECPQSTYMLFLNPLIVLLLTGSSESSTSALVALTTLVRRSDNIRDGLVKIGFIEAARQSLIDENTLNYTQSNILEIIQSLLFQQVNANEMIGLVSILSQLSEEKSEEKKKIAQKAKMILNLLSGFGITDSSSSNNIQLEKINEELKIQIEEQKRNNNELQRKDQEKQKQIIELQKKNEEFKKKDEEKSKKIIELQRKDEDNQRKIADLERQLADSKSKPIINNQIVSQPKSEEIPISISVPSGGYTKKEGEFTYTSTKYKDQTFPIDQQIKNGKYRCEFKINKLEDYQYFGVMKSGPSVPFDGQPSYSPHNKNSMFFRHGGEVKQNGIQLKGNQPMKSGDIIALEVNMDIVPRTVRLFINGVLQPVYASGIPDSIQFYFHFSQKENSVTVLSLKRLSSPTDATVIGANEVQWE